MSTATAKSAPSTRRGVTEQAAVAAIDSATRVLRLPTIRDRFTEMAAAAQREQLSYLGFLAELVMAECDDRDRRRAARRIHDAGFPRGKHIEEFDFEANSSVSPAVIHQLATCAWVKAGHPLCLIGDSGTGKSHLLIGLGTVAAEPGNRVRYTLASKLVNELAEAADDKQLSKTIARYGRVDLLCLDELGYLELDRRGAELLFQVLTEREERSAIAIASNEPRLAGPRPSPTRGSARPSSTGSPSPDRSSRPAQPPTGWPTPASGAPPAERPAAPGREPGRYSLGNAGHRPEPLPRPARGRARPGTPTGRAPEQHRPGGNSR